MAAQHGESIRFFFYTAHSPPPPIPTTHNELMVNTDSLVKGVTGRPHQNPDPDNRIRIWTRLTITPAR